MTLDEIGNLPAEEAIKILDKIIEKAPDDAALSLRGMKHWALGNRAQAINDYLRAISLNPESKSVQLLENAQAILDFYNKDLLNP